MAAIDITTVEVWTKSGLTTFYLLFVIELKTQRIHFERCTTKWLPPRSPKAASTRSLSRTMVLPRLRCSGYTRQPTLANASRTERIPPDSSGNNQHGLAPYG